MDLSWLLTTASLLILLYAGFTWLRGQTPRRESVKNNPPLPRYKPRSPRSRRSNVENAGSAHQGAAGQGSNVQPNVQRSAEIAGDVAPPAGPAGTLAITPNELQQLAEALAVRAGGATVEEALRKGFGVRKGGSAGYQRAKALFDAATAVPAGQ